ncbi:MAG: transcriptional regulator GcvA [Pseudomonadota bacterium]
MPRRLPPLNALRAFEAAARHLSFTRAADELAVTQAAISHQVKALEDHLGVPLFRRLNRRLMLTDAGQGYLPPLRDAFDKMEQATGQLFEEDMNRALRVTALPSFAAKWLLPRLGRFRAQHPEIDVLVSATDVVIDFAKENFDMALRYGTGRYAGLRSDYLMGDHVLPVCSPHLAKGLPPLERPEDLRHHTLLHDDMARNDASSNDWISWLRAAGVKGVNASRGPAFSHSTMVMEAAMDGQGVALGRISLAWEDQASGRLVGPFGPVVRAPFHYYVVSPPERAEHPNVALFREWLLAQAADSGTDAQGLPAFTTPLNAAPPPHKTQRN